MALMDYVKLYREKGQEAWAKATGRQRMIFGGIGAVILVGFFLLVAGFGSGGGGMVPLKVPVTDTHTAIKRLAMFQIQAEVSEEESNILVPREKEKNAVWVLASARMLPDAKQHYQFLRDTDLTATDARMQETVRTTVEELLSETIGALSFISQAEVRIAPPDKRWHVGNILNEAQAKASVAVGLRDQDMLDDTQVAGIVQLVSFAYPTMPSENVAITDMNGRPYRYNNNWEIVADYMKTKVREEQMIAMKAENVMISFKPRASATVAIDQATENERGKYYLDDEGRPVYRETREESDTNTKRAGPAGAIGEVGRSAREDTPGMSELVGNRELGEGVEKLEYSTREVERTEHGKLQIDYNLSAVTVTVDEEHKDKIEPEIDNWKTALSNATNIPTDKISIMFAPAPEIAGGGGGALGGIMSTLLKPDMLVKVVLLVIAIGAFIAMMLMLKKSAPKPLTLIDEDMVEEEPEPLPDVPHLPPVNQLEGNVVREKVVELVKKNPQAAANLVKRWILFGK